MAKRIGLLLVGLSWVCLLLAACGPARSYTPTPVPAWEHVRNEFREPPPELPPKDQRSFEKGWNALVEGNLEGAAEDLERLGRRYRDDVVVNSALGYLELRLGDREAAAKRFTSALSKAPSYRPAQAGWVLAALVEGNEEEAFNRLRFLKKDHPEHSLVTDFLPNLQLKLAESNLQAARSLRRQQRYKQAANMYREALRIAPEAGGLYAETAEVELLGGEPEEAAAHAARAVELEPESARFHLLRGDALRESGELERAIEAYEKAGTLGAEDPSLFARIEDTRRKLQRETLPPQFAEIAGAQRVTREELALLIYIRLRPMLENAETRAHVIATDIADSWAREFILQVVGTGIMDIFPNHTFQPEAFVKKVDLAVTLIAARDTLSKVEESYSMSELVIEDVSPEYLNYRAVASAVALGFLTTDNEGRFEPLRYVNGQEAVDAVDALAKRLVP